MNGKKLLLNFIMKNEAKNLPRMLEAVNPMVYGAAVTDTGSTDDSVELVQDFFAGVGKPVWVNRDIDGVWEDDELGPLFNFAAARNVALRHARGLLARGEADWDYVFLCDCDMELVIDDRKAIPDFTAACYAIMQDNAIVRYWNARMLRRDMTCEYVGRTHECITPDEQPVAIGGMWFKDHETGANRYDKYVRDVRILKRELLEDPMNPRHMFYMVQSLLGAGMIEDARKFCDMRVRLSDTTGEGLDEETFWVKLQMARFDDMLGRDPAVIQREFLQAYEFRPIRAEPLVHLATYLRKRGEMRSALLFARRAALMPPPPEILPIETAVYSWMAADEWLSLAIACDDGAEAWQAAQLLRKRVDILPDSERERIVLNCSLVTKRKTTKRGHK